jgi:hypothetical protein
MELQEIAKTKEADLITKAKLQKQAEEQQNVLFAKQVQQAVVNTDIISKERKGKVAAFIVNPVNKNGSVQTDITRVVNNILANPNHIVQLADILFDYDFEKGIQTDRFIKQGQIKSIQSLKEKLDNKLGSAKANSTSRNNGSNKSGDLNWDDFLKN